MALKSVKKNIVWWWVKQYGGKMHLHYMKEVFRIHTIWCGITMWMVIKMEIPNGEIQIRKLLFGNLDK